MDRYRIPILKPFVAPEAIRLVQDTLTSGWIGEGNRVAEFENIIGRFIQNQKFLSLNSCTSSLDLALHLIGVSQNDEVISTPITCLATNLPILNRKAKIVWADICEDGTIDPESIRRCITSRTVAIVVVHIGGYPCDMQSVIALAQEYNLPVIEDAAHALGSTYHGIPIGSHSEFVCFSFQAVKTITMADGGGLAFRSQEQYRLAKRLRWFGLNREDPDRLDKDLAIPGFRICTNDVLASLGIANMAHVDELLRRRQEIARAYSDAFDEVPSIKLCHSPKSDRHSSFWLFPIMVHNKYDLKIFLRNCGIEASEVHKRNDHYSVFAASRRINMPGVDRWDHEMLCLPIGHWLTDDDVNYVIQAVRRWGGC